jgi:hypothetical protein
MVSFILQLRHYLCIYLASTEKAEVLLAAEDWEVLWAQWNRIGHQVPSLTFISFVY